MVERLTLMSLFLDEKNKVVDWNHGKHKGYLSFSPSMDLLMNLLRPLPLEIIYYCVNRCSS